MPPLHTRNPLGRLLSFHGTERHILQAKINLGSVRIPNLAEYSKDGGWAGPPGAQERFQDCFQGSNPEGQEGSVTSEL